MHGQISDTRVACAQVVGRLEGIVGLEAILWDAGEENLKRNLRPRSGNVGDDNVTWGTVVPIRIGCCERVKVA